MITVNFAASAPRTPAPEKRHAGKISSLELQTVLELHQQWLVSNGQEGTQADLTRADLETLDLTDARLPAAILNQANLRGVDLLLADLAGASLLQADLRDANLLGTRLREASLQGANLTGAKALLGEQLAGANLFGALLPDSVSISEAVKQVRALANRTGWLLAATLLFSALACFRVATIADVQLIKNSPTLPFAASATALPLVPFFLFCPVLILGLYIFLHFHIQRMWEACADLPAILPDGLRLDACLPWFARWPARRHFRWLKQNSPAISALGTGIAKLLLYAPAPAAVLLFWGRYLTLHDLRGTTLQVLLTVTGVAASIYFHAAAHRAFASDPLPLAWTNAASTGSRHWGSRAILPTLALLLFLLSVGAIFGAPHHGSLASPRGANAIRTWAADAFWLLGYEPYANLTESSVSSGPRTSQDGKDALAQVLGANLNGANLRYAQAYRAFFAKSRLWQADLRDARLSEADLRETNLRQATLRSADLDQARLNRANLQDADLHDANLAQADLTEANLSYAFLTGAILVDAKLDGADLYAAQFQDALLQRATLQKADLREADLEGADLTAANLREAYLSSAKMAGAHLQQSHLEQAILMQADLQHADLSGANFEGAILQESNLSGANLQGTRLRGALGLSASQLCSAVNLRQAQLDDALQHDVDLQCVTTH